jgi:hypothetical protein
MTSWDTIPENLTGSYQPRTDHLRFSAPIPDAFPFISFAAEHPQRVAPLAVLVEEWMHRCQMAATPLGLLYRSSCLAQMRLGLGLLRVLAADPALRLPPPWLSDGIPEDETLRDGIRQLRALEGLQRFLLGVALGLPVSQLNTALSSARQALEALTPLRFGTFQLWDVNRLYRDDGTPLMQRATRGILESHASAYAAELILACSQRKARGWVVDHVRRNRIGLYRALEEIAEAAHADAAQLSTHHVLTLADWALAGHFTDIVGFPPPVDYIEGALPYTRYETALRDVERFGDAADAIASTDPDHARLLATPDDRTDLAVRTAVNARGQASALLGLEPMSHRPMMETLIREALSWEEEQLARLASEDPLSHLDRTVVNGVAYASIRYFKILAEFQTDSTIFTPQQDTFVLLARFCDWPVIEYEDELQVFLCDPMDDPGPIMGQQALLYQLATALRPYMTESFDARHDCVVLGEPVHRLAGISPDQLR